MNIKEMIDDLMRERDAIDRAIHALHEVELRRAKSRRPNTEPPPPSQTTNKPFSPTSMSPSIREEIVRLLAENVHTPKEIAKIVGVAFSTVYKIRRAVGGK